MPPTNSGRKGVLGHGLESLKRLRNSTDGGSAPSPAAETKPVSKKRQKMLPPATAPRRVPVTASIGQAASQARSQDTRIGHGRVPNARSGQRNAGGGSGGGDDNAGNRGEYRTTYSPTASNSERAPKRGVQPAGTQQTPPAPSPAISPADAALFRRAVASVAPIKDTRRAILPHVAQDSPDILRQRRESAAGEPHRPMPPVSDAFTPASQHDDDTRYLRNADSAGLIKDLERGRWAPQAVLDLHGDTLEQARERLDRFLASCLAHNIRCVRIIHGKGYGSRDGQPVLRSALRRWLTQLATVQAYAQCNEEDGGAGAVHVLLD